MNRPWHSMSIEEVVRELGTDIKHGLSDEEVNERLKKYGPNEIIVKEKSPLLMFLRQFTNFLIIVLIVAIIISAIIGETIDAVAIAMIVLIMGIMGFIQEYKAEKAIKALKKLATPRCTVIRNGVQVEIPTHNLVPGDVVLIKEGDKIPADARLVEAFDLEIDESPLTGESTPVEKDPELILSPQTPISDRKNMVFSGTYVVRGKGKAVVTATGNNTELGKIARMVAETKEGKTILERELDLFGKRIGLLVLAIALFVFMIGILEERDNIIHPLMTAVALAVAAIPEGLPAIATAIMAIGAYRMARKKALVRKLSAVESLGSVDIICTDKTGTITKGEMTVKVIKTIDNTCHVEGSGYAPFGGIICDNDEDLSLLYKMIVAHTSIDVSLHRSDNKWLIKGSPTEGAALVLGYKALGEKDVLKVLEELPVIRTYPFDRIRKRKTSIHRFGDKYLVISTGAPEILLDISNRVVHGGEEKPLDNETREKILKIIEEMASEGYRTFGVAYRVLDHYNGEMDMKDVENNMVFYAVLGIIDPPREGVKEAVEIAKKAGIKTVIVTGDHKLTAIAVAKMVGIETDNGMVLDGKELDYMSDEELLNIIDKVVVFARVTPEHKARIVNLLKRKGYRVAMTGDGVNDAPALKAADIGVAMGIRGTEVAKEASQLILLDDNYVTIVEAIREGRIIYENIKKPINYLLSANMGEVFTILLSQLLLKRPALEPIHLLWINVVTDSFPAIALGVEPPEPGIMEKPPRSRDERLITRRKIIYYISIGLLIALFTVMAFTEGLGICPLTAITSAYTTIVLTEFGRSIASRSENTMIWRLGHNKWLYLSLIGSMCLYLITIYTPLSRIFNTTPIPITLWVHGLIASVTIFLLDEARKMLNVKI
ncbi:MAG: cation-transporting P-type ATPase [Desulfurococcaceae archaeon]